MVLEVCLGEKRRIFLGRIYFKGVGVRSDLFDFVTVFYFEGGRSCSVLFICFLVWVFRDLCFSFLEDGVRREDCK